ncbi:UNVERIFIED_CONTAM: hypothetical protein Slati_3711400 [Sesamum latifolium]|uniref:Retrovirus-related Pol polyprotein from transposon TNT 1-94-like beta-barrel domain-containing protein n=1 Tax=Sesamum latifolium TaxID=2727402 RepID=A0AAW2U3L9_9LAMI
MLSLVEKLEDLKARLDNDTYIDVILQSLPPSCDPFVVNYNMNGLEKSVHELINTLVQYGATIHKLRPSVLIEEARPPKLMARGPDAAKGRRKKGRLLQPLHALPSPLLPLWKWTKGKAKPEALSGLRQMMYACIVKERGIGRESAHNSSNHGMLVVEVNMITNSASWILDTGCGAHICSDLQVLQKTRRLTKDDMILRLGDAKAVAVEAIGSVELAISHHEKITKKLFVRQSTLANGLEDLIYTNVCGSLKTQARGGYSYFITFTDDQITVWLYLPDESQV